MTDAPPIVARRRDGKLFHVSHAPLPFDHVDLFACVGPYEHIATTSATLAADYMPVSRTSRSAEVSP